MRFSGSYGMPSLVLNGTMAGKTMQLSGMLGTQQVELETYFDVAGAYSGAPESLIVYQMPYPVGAGHTDGYSGTLSPVK
jgi:hypothetical protein